MPTLIDTARIRTDLGTQPRVEMNDEIVKEYSELMEQGEKFPAIDVVYDDVKNYFILVDGFHRLAAHKKALPNNQIYAEVKRGTIDDATWDCLAVNKSHGLRRTNADKRNAVEQALLHPNGEKSTDRDIARHVGVSHPMVMSIRAELESVGKLYQQETRIGSDGKTYNAAKNKRGNPNFRPLSGGEFYIVEDESPDWEMCENCDYYSPPNKKDAGYCHFAFMEVPPNGTCGGFKDIVVTDSKEAPAKIVNLDEIETFEPKSKDRTQRDYGAITKGKNAIKVTVALQNAELAACELLNCLGIDYLASIWAAIQKINKD